MERKRERIQKRERKRNLRDPALGTLVARIPQGIHDSAHQPPEAQARGGNRGPQAGDEEQRHPGGEVLGEVGVRALGAVEAVGGRALLGLLGGRVRVGVADALFSRPHCSLSAMPLSHNLFFFFLPPSLSRALHS